ncbi:hypothetical protein M3J09_009561 [Ascochyta lentis]
MNACNGNTKVANEISKRNTQSLELYSLAFVDTVSGMVELSMLIANDWRDLRYQWLLYYLSPSPESPVIPVIPLNTLIVDQACISSL